ncbi:hypothetical protein B0H65DRAFT_478162 [Neurospora tetraspora]|uniref:Uncharacterized protein n=1 Tax=Neurospora tetraspora TaxID=94610 RepID=A0AAE0MMP2_9PEZI|nr:hypothetical protein B0H65DRAFT_478162 [Neurospora tetraspora]
MFVWYLWLSAVVVQPLSLTVPDIPCLLFSVLVFSVFSFPSLLPLPLCFALSNCPPSSGHVGFHFHIEIPDNSRLQDSNTLLLRGRPERSSTPVVVHSEALPARTEVAFCFLSERLAPQRFSQDPRHGMVRHGVREGPVKQSDSSQH